MRLSSTNKTRSLVACSARSLVDGADVDGDGCAARVRVAAAALDTAGDEPGACGLGALEPEKSAGVDFRREFGDRL